MKSSTKQYNAIPYDTMKEQAILCNQFKYDTIPCRAMPYNIMKGHAMQSNETQYHVIPNNTIKYNTILCNITKYDEIPSITMQYNYDCHAIPSIQ